MAGEIEAEVCVVISNNSASKSLARARAAGIRAVHLSSKTHPDPSELDRSILRTLLENRVELVVLAGYMKRIGPEVLSSYKNRVINIHPALLPKYGGRGMYGINVHRAVLEAGETESGATVHVVDGRYDHGAVLTRRRVPVRSGDVPEILAERILEHEHRLMTETIGMIASGQIELADGPEPYIIRPIEAQLGDAGDLEESLRVVRSAFSTVAAEMDLTRENCPAHPSFTEIDGLVELAEKDTEFFGLYTDGFSAVPRQVGFAVVERSPDDPATFYIEKVAVVPEVRHRGYGSRLMEHAIRLVQLRGGRRVSVALIDEQKILKEWYAAMGFLETGAKRFEHLPFTVCFMAKEVTAGE